MREGARRIIDKLINDAQESECASDSNSRWAHIFNDMKDLIDEQGERGGPYAAGIVAELITLLAEDEADLLTTPSPSGDASATDC